MQAAESEIEPVEASEGVGRKEQPIMPNPKLASESTAKDTDDHLPEADRQSPETEASLKQQAEAQPKLLAAQINT